MFARYQFVRLDTSDNDPFVGLVVTTLCKVGR